MPYSSINAGTETPRRCLSRSARCWRGVSLRCPRGCLLTASPGVGGLLALLSADVSALSARLSAALSANWVHWVSISSMTFTRVVVSANLLHGFEQLYLQNPRTGDLCGEWGGNEVSMMLRSLAYVCD